MLWKCRFQEPFDVSLSVRTEASSAAIAPSRRFMDHQYVQELISGYVYAAVATLALQAPLTSIFPTISDKITSDGENFD
ncbi:hypothetical protein TrLO_g1976 [Triparma laevis f. longispina]|uniref:Uncharacterized protein n=1 Tax=Triparma laevis f. longispina TaxID=1714387 RepID=A0A9W7CF50_9STRA|nr:hypothetical protein TrLO_g1976 [Triparma laevis f. longispina]